MKTSSKEIRRFPRELEPKSEVLQIRISDTEKEGFELAAALAGISLSSWVRERLRLTAIRELEGAGRKVPFVPDISVGG
jgi:predicted HicB family RNase H-like nuclease